MKTKNIIRTLLLATALGMASCDDLLDKSPRDKFLDSPEFWSSSISKASVTTKPTTTLTTGATPQCPARPATGRTPGQRYGVPII